MVVNFWNYISSIGVDSNYDDLLTRKIKLTNRFSVIAIIVFLFSGLNNYLLGDIFSALLIESLALLCILGFYFNKKKFHRFTTSFLFSITTLAVFYFDSYSGILSGTYLFHFPIVLAIAFIFDYREDRIVMFLHLLLIAILLCINMFTDYSLFRSNFITDDKRYQMFMFNLLFSVISVSFLCI